MASSTSMRFGKMAKSWKSSSRRLKTLLKRKRSSKNWKGATNDKSKLMRRGMTKLTWQNRKRILASGSNWCSSPRKRPSWKSGFEDWKRKRYITKRNWIDSKMSNSPNTAGKTANPTQFWMTATSFSTCWEKAGTQKFIKPTTLTIAKKSHAKFTAFKASGLKAWRQIISSTPWERIRLTGSWTTLE